jgi:hypothetical protein
MTFIDLKKTRTKFLEQQRIEASKVAAPQPVNRPKEYPTYSPFFQTIYEEKEYTILRSVNWQNPYDLSVLPKPGFHDMAFIWDGDHDCRVADVARLLYISGLLAPVTILGEHKGGLTVVAGYKFQFEQYAKDVKQCIESRPLDCDVEVTKLANVGSCYALECESELCRKVTDLWQLGVKSINFEEEACL